MTSNELRARFLAFFASKGHTVVRSSPLVPGNDATLLFTNAGMVQFKDVFTGQDKRPYVRAASSQKCVRAGGKHNDLENVGYTARHHTFFEMLGNFSFGDYFKPEAIAYAWEFITSPEWLGIDKSRLLVTVYHTDDEAFALWHEKAGVPKDRIVRIGDNKGAPYASDNFWAMGDTGPCGPCTEIFYDHDPDGSKGIYGGPPGSPEEDGDRWIEIWNVVFMQFERTLLNSMSYAEILPQEASLHQRMIDQRVEEIESRGNLAIVTHGKNASGQPAHTVNEYRMAKLPAPSVDTGMGLERIAALMQGSNDNYSTDTFRQLITAVAALAGQKPYENPSQKVIADHIRASSFLITDGVLPSNEGRGYVLRRIMRRAIRHGYKLGINTAFFHKLVAPLAEAMGEAYPELREKQALIEKAIRAEEDSFATTLDKGMKLLDEAIAKVSDGVIPGEVVFKLYDTYGFPLDLTADVAREKNLKIDEPGYEREMEAQRTRARAASSFKTGEAVKYEGPATSFLGYTETAITGAKVLALYKDGQPIPQLNAGEEGQVVLDNTPFYAESGGQVGDTGSLKADGTSFDVRDTQKIAGAAFAHIGQLQSGSLSVGMEVSAQIETSQRRASMRNHSATHLLHRALRDVLGEHVAQKGSLVNAERTRFDFSHTQAVTAAEIAEIERRVNHAILSNVPAEAAVMGFDDAVASGAMALFGEKYGDEVRVLKMGEFSTDLCGGTHVGRTGDIGSFKIIAESGIASGVRRIEAVAGEPALAWANATEAKLKEAASLLKAGRDDLADKISALLEHSKQLEKQLAAAKTKLAASQGDELLAGAATIKGVKLLAAQVDGLDGNGLRTLHDQLKAKLPSGIVLLGSSADGKVSLLAGVSADLTGKLKAGELVNFAAQQVGGKGGGRPDLAQAGGTDVAQLPAAIASVAGWVEAKL